MPISYFANCVLVFVLLQTNVVSAPRVTLQEITTEFWQSTPAVITHHVVLSCSNPHRVFYASCHALRSTVYKCGFLPVYCVNCFYVMLLWWLISFSDLFCCLWLRINLSLLSRHILCVLRCGFQVYLSFLRCTCLYSCYMIRNTLHRLGFLRFLFSFVVPVLPLISLGAVMFYCCGVLLLCTHCINVIHYP